MLFFFFLFSFFSLFFSVWWLFLWFYYRFAAVCVCEWLRFGRKKKFKFTKSVRCIGSLDHWFCIFFFFSSNRFGDLTKIHNLCIQFVSFLEFVYRLENPQTRFALSSIFFLFFFFFALSLRFCQRVYATILSQIYCNFSRFIKRNRFLLLHHLYKSSHTKSINDKRSAHAKRNHKQIIIIFWISSAMSTRSWIGSKIDSLSPFSFPGSLIKLIDCLLLLKKGHSGNCFFLFSFFFYRLNLCTVVKLIRLYLCLCCNLST